MKRYQNHNSIKEPTLFAWIVLLVAWLSVLPLSAYLFRPKQQSPVDAAPVFRPAVPEEEPERLSIGFNIRTIAPVNALRADKPTILIYHTHTTEAYTQTETQPYRETGKWRTNDNTKNVVAVGEVLKEILETDYGFTVIHDTTDHEPPKLSTAYDRSLETMERYHAEYPSIALFIDLHRDAYSADNAPCDYLMIRDTETAKLMLVVGKGEKYAEKPYFISNAAFAERITAHLNAIDPHFCRPVRIKPGRYNQHVAPNCILVEVGHNANTLSQAKAAMPYLAESIAYAFHSGEINRTDWVPN